MTSWSSQQIYIWSVATIEIVSADIFPENGAEYWLCGLRKGAR
jgi:hypothetical protein